jgi:hypothetical protein
MTEIGGSEAESPGTAKGAARVSPPVDWDPASGPGLGASLARRLGGPSHRLESDGAKALYIDQPTIPVEMTIETYRRVRARHKPHRLRRLASLGLWRDRQAMSPLARQRADRRHTLLSDDSSSATASDAHDKSNV